MAFTLGFIGCGNMGGALVKAAANTLSAKEIAICDFDAAKVEKYENEVGVVGSSAREIAQSAKFVVLAVKPQMMASAIAEFADLLVARDDVVVITMAAGLSIAAIRGFIGKDLPVIRIMPNTPAMVGKGMILYTVSGVSDTDKQEFLTAFSKAGLFDELPESAIDAGSAVSGCGPAFFYAYAKAIAKGGVECGLTAEQAEKYAAQTMLGAAEMLLAYGDPDTLIKNVCSPGGTTIEGMKSLWGNDIDKVGADAVLAAYARTLELKK